MDLCRATKNEVVLASLLSVPPLSSHKSKMYLVYLFQSDNTDKICLSRTAPGTRKAESTFQEDGQLVLRDSQGRGMWISNKTELAIERVDEGFELEAQDLDLWDIDTERYETFQFITTSSGPSLLFKDGEICNKWIRLHDHVYEYQCIFGKSNNWRMIPEDKLADFMFFELVLKVSL